MYRLHLSVVGLVLASLIAMPVAFAFADRDDDDDDDRGRRSSSSSSTSNALTDSLKNQIKQLQDQLKQLQDQRKDVRKDLKEAIKNNSVNASSTSWTQFTDLNKQIANTQSNLNQTKKELKFARNLSRGMSGDDVKILQELLAQDPEIFSNADITGFFGPRTEAALRKFQKKHGLDSVGIFGPKTQAKILALFAGRELPPGIAARLGLAFGSTTPGVGFVTICHKESGKNPVNLSIPVAALGGHLGHGDTLGLCAGTGTGTTTPDTTAPSISGLGITNVTTTGATVSFVTNENTTAKIFYSSTTPVNTSTALSVSTSTLKTSHSFSLSSLNPSTTYYFVVEAKDASNNTATTSQSQFTTSAVPDTTAPLISGVGISGLSSTTATFVWNTNENATGKVYYSTTTPINLASAWNVGTTTTSLGHSFTLTGLTASTTYYYMLESKDASSNTATTSQGTFVTGN